MPHRLALDLAIPNPFLDRAAVELSRLSSCNPPADYQQLPIPRKSREYRYNIDITFFTKATTSGTALNRGFVMRVILSDDRSDHTAPRSHG